MKNQDEDYAFEQRRQARLDAEDSINWPQWHQKVGTKVPFSSTLDKDPNPRIPLSVPQERPNPSLVFILSALAMLLILLLGAS